MTAYSRREFIIGGSSLALVGAAPGAMANAFPASTHATLANLLLQFPYISDGQGPPLYMLTNANCVNCQAFHKEFPRGVAGTEMRYMVTPWAQDPVGVLNRLYRERTFAAFSAYVRRALTAPHTRAASPHLVTAGRNGSALQRITQENFELTGTPLFFYPVSRPTREIYVFLGWGPRIRADFLEMQRKLKPTA
jgi:hypothetical protein